MTILITGGAGYIGSVVVSALRQAGRECVVVDNLSRGHRQAVPADVPFYVEDAGAVARITEICRGHRVDAAVHLAAFAYVGESVENPLAYYANNLGQTLGLLQGLQAAGVNRMVFSSSCSVYGEQAVLPVCETQVPHPTSPYGRTKLMVEQVLADFDRAFGIRHVALRYFNAAGATSNLGEDHRPESHLIPLLLRAAADGGPFTLFGADYPTADGTAIRDYIHVLDIAAAHVASLDYLKDGGSSAVINLGTGRGWSVREVVTQVEEITGRRLHIAAGPRRPGDPPAVYAACDRAQDLLGWQAQTSDLREIIASAWAWRRQHPYGYD